MGDYISRQEAIEAVLARPALHGAEGSWYHADDIRGAIKDLPSADVRENVKGEWMDVNRDGNIYECSICGEKVCCPNNNFCPNCGADMRGDSVRECPQCGSKHIEEHGTNVGDYNWWLCRNCGWNTHRNETNEEEHSNHIASAIASANSLCDTARRRNCSR